MKLTIAQIDKVLFSEQAESVTVPGTSGEMTILSHHMPLITTIKQGSITVKNLGKPDVIFQVTSGFLEVGKDEVIILL